MPDELVLAVKLLAIYRLSCPAVREYNISQPDDLAGYLA